MVLTRSLQNLYAATIDRSKFRETASRIIVFVTPAVFGWGREPYWGALAIIAAGVFMRSWAAGYLYKDKTMAAGGPYLLVRHPLYLGSCLLSLGLIVALHHWVVTALLGTVTALQYWHTIRHEEQNLLKRFGEPYARFCRETGPLWPRVAALRNFARSRKSQRFSFDQYLANREYECLLGVLAVLVILFIGSR
jgi:protein-S-isoprenylcysteine O-methyltransferase Ste14